MWVTRVIGTKIRRRAEHLADEPEHAGLAGLGADRDHEVADLAHLVALWVEDRQAYQPGGVDARRVSCSRA